MVYLRKLMSKVFFLKDFTNYVLISCIYSMKNPFDQLNSVIKSISIILLTINTGNYKV